MRKGEYRGINVSAGPFLRHNRLKELRLFSLDKQNKTPEGWSGAGYNMMMADEISE